MSIKGSVTINISEDGTVTLIPPVGLLDRNIQKMQWSLNAPERYRFAPEPIIFQTTDLPPGFIPWSPPGETPVLENDWQVSAKANFKVPKGNPPVKYRYDIWVIETITGEEGTVSSEPLKPLARQLFCLDPATLEKIDPDMENQPQP